MVIRQSSAWQYLLLIETEAAIVRFWPRLCGKSSISSQFGVYSEIQSAFDATDWDYRHSFEILGGSSKEIFCGLRVS
jgi:hypothetical protein